MIRNQLEASRINAVRLFKHEPCWTPVDLCRASTSYFPDAQGRRGWPGRVFSPGTSPSPAMTLPSDTRRSSRGGEVHCGFRERRQAFVGLLLLLQGLIQQPNGVFHVELAGPLFQCAVARDFVVFDGLRRCKHAGVKRLAALVLLHDLLALLEDALDRIAGLAARRHVEHLENLLETLDMAFGLAMMLLERRA